MGFFSNTLVKNISIGNEVQFENNSMMNLFSSCSNFSGPVTIPNGVTNIAYIFQNCSVFNSPITIPDSVTYMPNAFRVCSNFNQPIVIPDKVKNLASAFASCGNFNQPIIIPNSVIDLEGTFEYCYNFNQPIVIPCNVTSMRHIFRQSSNMRSNITILSPNINDFFGAFQVAGLYNSINVFVPANTTTNSSIFTAYYIRNFGQQTLTWDTNTSNNCRYNAKYGIYVHWL